MFATMFATMFAMMFFMLAARADRQHARLDPFPPFIARGWPCQTLRVLTMWSLLPPVTPENCAKPHHPNPPTNRLRKLTGYRYDRRKSMEGRL
jgi:hypothetical protein